MRSWSLWSMRRSAVLVLVGVEVVAAGLVGLAWLAEPAPSAAQWLRWLVLVALAIGYAEATRRVELLYRYLSAPTGRVTVVGVWALPAALVLPAGLAALLNLVVTAQLVVWVARTASNRVHRELFTNATGVLASLAGSAISGATGLRDAFWSFSWPAWAPLGLLAVIGAYTLVNAGLIVAGMYAAVRPPRLRGVLLRADDLAFEYASLLLGVLVAVTLTRTPWLTPAATAVLMLLQRSALVAKLRDAATQDSKTGLLNAATWEQRAANQLARAGRDGSPAALLLVDLDHFKRVNDTRGHLAGDAALRAVADALTAELRGQDVIGRYGGEEFVVYLPGAGRAIATAVAERVRARIATAADIPVTVSVGVAVHPQHGDTITGLFTVADRALYAAKHAGRNRVSVG